MNDFEWQKECRYISDLADKKGNVPEMNHDAATAVRYMAMQRDAATREGFHDAATYIGECLDDMPACPWQTFAAVLDSERNASPDQRRRELLSRLLGSVRKLAP